MKKIKEITLTGLSTSPSDYEVPDGALSMASNVQYKDAAITPAASTAPSVLLFGEYNEEQHINENVIYQHANVGYCHLIYSYSVTGQSGLKYAYASKPTETTTFIDATIGDFNTELSGITVNRVSSMGNFLMFYTDSDVYYYMFKNNAYKFLGTHIPELQFSWGLKLNRTYLSEMGEYGTADDIDVYMSYQVRSQSHKWQFLWDATSKKNVSDAVYGAIASYIRQEYKLHRITQPHFIRYAYRMFDGSLTMPSAPVLLIPTTTSPFAEIRTCVFDETAMSFVLKCNIKSISAGIDYLILNSEQIDNLKNNWSDIVKSICIFITSPISTYDTSSEIDSFEYDISSETNWSNYAKDYLYENAYAIGSSVDYSQYQSYHKYPLSSFAFKTKDMYFGTLVFDTYRPYRFHVPLIDKDAFEKKLVSEQASSFYLVKEIPLDQLASTSERTILQFDTIGKPDNLSLEAHESLVTDYRALDTIVPGPVTTYNGRVNYAGINRIPYTDFDIFSLISYQEKLSDGTDQQARLYARLYESDCTSIIRSAVTQIPSDVCMPFLYYPNQNITDMYLQIPYVDTAQPQLKSLPSRIHDFMDGTYSLNLGFDISSLQTSSSTIDVGNIAAPISIKSTIFTSDALNPFRFDAANVQTIDAGEILAMVPISIPLTQDATGGSDMIAFTEHGLWTLSPSDTGSWTMQHSISRDILRDSNSVLQLDQSIIFATTRGLMHLSGNAFNNIQIQCMTEIFDGNADTFAAQNISLFRKYLQQTPQLEALPDFSQFINGSSMHYDYTGQRILIGNKSKDITFAYSIRDKAWTTLPLRIISSVNSYPDALAMASIDGHPCLIDLSVQTDADAYQSLGTLPQHGFILTRPIKFDEPDALKTISTIVARGQFNGNAFIQSVKAGASSSPVSIILFASRDLYQWFQIASSIGPRLVSKHGTPYRYFRIALITRLAAGESLSRITVEYEPRLLNKIR